MSNTNPFDGDKFNSIPMSVTTGAAFNILNTLQNNTREVQLAAISVLFSGVCEVFELNVREVLEKTERMLSLEKYQDEEARRKIQAFKAYIKGELL